MSNLASGEIINLKGLDDIWIWGNSVPGPLAAEFQEFSHHARSPNRVLTTLDLRFSLRQEFPEMHQFLALFQQVERTANYRRFIGKVRLPGLATKYRHNPLNDFGI
jgi:hypothetical protein